ncbi:hypothetical protein PBI_KAMPE_5 [Gordonia phage Kampe]|uniref:Uncharacterized protein n=3 Tax=Gordonia phage Orchid TaxID=1838075 RepID=A0A160DHK7_9CAUD|nr:hypothetical protein BH761_gp005 [Gordonia phage Orchid]ANA87239.1 hypothetical protein PBI_PATRICKSTAR_5 [Gordonia phage PatrickStar]ANA87463.1 hypothetical protein PBI_ORCHID_5 [Gordonia phage Orchid]ANA87578.1 hypothetical protein PBI_KAMPE_5 [Gordonia phage Kampe]
MIYYGTVFYCDCNDCGASLTTYNGSRAFIHQEHLLDRFKDMKWDINSAGITRCPDCFQKLLKSITEAKTG